MGLVRNSRHTKGMPIWQRRVLVLALNIATTPFLLWQFYLLYEPDGISTLELLILACTFFCVPWSVLNFWNAVITLCLLAFGNAEDSVYPYFKGTGELPEISSKTALVFFLRNEDPGPLFDRMHAMHKSLQDTKQVQHFRFVLLSDTSQDDVAKMEGQGFVQIRDEIAKGMSRPPFYRRRRENVTWKAGNLKDYLDHHSGGDDFFVPLDQDSAMAGDLLVRMVSSMEKHSRIGIMQTLCYGMPAASAFTRLYQFGIRQSMQTYNLGNSWWTADCGLYWGHNAIIRTKAFHKHCMLPKLPGKPPLGGHILSHDLIEAMFMRSAGYEVRIVPCETQSYETHPPTLIDYLRRELRWCQGTMQYWFLLTRPGLHPLSRFHACQTLATYLTQAVQAVMAFATIINVLSGGVSSSAETKARFLALQLTMAVIGDGCKIAGHLNVALTSLPRYGGFLNWILSVLVEALLLFPLAAITSVSVFHFFVKLMLTGKTISWDGQNRDRLGLSWRSALEALWPHTVIGLSCIAAMVVIEHDFSTLLWGWLWAACLIMAAPYAVFTASPRFGRLAVRFRLFTDPEELMLPSILSTLIPKEIKPIKVEKASII
ncbi:Glucans biosynthesis glucosyltransferase H [Cercospora beticola]|uniref:Glucans biosynthesis glucosyltransferase H n=2 Tax=Cercospora beticola TaxID=122368 RepID=A0A2G5HQ04_CERBT|nr:Glucans biosynthesis glucosyltransferase H [Cercospora beticola]PIA94302.1 Glucans biosynthesis glucosyltransferase H [Cercospora beticola]